MRVKLVAVDLDGTFIPEGGQSPTQEDFRLIRELQDMGIMFAVNSGRPYGNIRRMFAGAQADIMYICDNGCNVKYRDNTVYLHPMDREKCRELHEDVQAMGPGCEMVMCTQDYLALVPKDPENVYCINNKWKMRAEGFECFDEIKDEIIKMSLYMPGGLSGDICNALREKWERRINHLAVSGAMWFDMQDGDKGTGMLEGARRLGISMEETVAFGDNFNDLEMLDTAGLSYVMSTSSEAVKSHGHRVCDSVQQVLRELIRSGGEI